MPRSGVEGPMRELPWKHTSAGGASRTHGVTILAAHA